MYSGWGVAVLFRRAVALLGTTRACPVASLRFASVKGEILGDYEKVLKQLRVRHYRVQVLSSFFGAAGRAVWLLRPGVELALGDLTEHEMLRSFRVSAKAVELSVGVAESSMVLREVAMSRSGG